ncbi:MAG: hypothetical protein KAR06_00740, partial [Deltaproteobacteria bacterium]|nr:hypothetical protein [Deltaproteobacteria bacterium]
MAVWAKIKMYWSSMLTASGAVVVASSTEATGDYDVAYLSNFLGVNSWLAASSATTTISCTQTGQYSNGDFELAAITGWIGEVAGTGAGTFAINSTAPYVGTYDGKFTITNPGTDITHIFVKPDDQIGSIKKGRVYKVLFGCNGQAAQTVRIALIGASSPFTVYATNVDKTITTSYAQYEATFTALQDADDVHVVFYMGNGGTWVQIDDIVFDEEEAVCSDYALAYGHNFLPETGTIPTLKLEYSDDNSTWTAVDTSLDGDTIHISSTKLWEFTKTAGHKYWRWSTTSPGNTTQIKCLLWGLKTELDFCSVSFDPDQFSPKKTVNTTYKGNVAGIHLDYNQRQMSFRINDADDTLYEKVRKYREDHGEKQLFIAWNTAEFPNDIAFMYPTGAFSNPMALTAIY